jgi:hypothetical protein
MNTCGCGPYVTSSLTRGRVCRLQLLLVLASAIILRSEFRGTHDHILLSQIRVSPYLYPPGTGWPGYTPRHWVPFSSPRTTRRATVEVFDPVSTRENCQFSTEFVFLPTLQGLNISIFSNNTLIVVDVFTDPLLRNVLNNPVVLLLLACILRALHSNSRCLEKHCLATGLYATIWIKYI